MMRIGNSLKKIKVQSYGFEIKRGEGGVAYIVADNHCNLQAGLGFAHAHDRFLQMCLTRTLACGQVTEFLLDTDEGFAIDVMMRKLGFQKDLAEDFQHVTDDAKRWCSAYCEGINYYLEKFGPPRLCKILKLPIQPWTPKDCLLLVKMHMYLGLAQAQERTERFIMQAIHDGAPLEYLKKLFNPHLDGLDENLAELIRSIHLECPYVDLEIKPGLSNNWAVTGKKTATGIPLCAADPHLQVNRLPAIWYEAVLKSEDDFQIGVTMPGCPGVVMGRSKNLCASFTYGMMDTMDFFIEEIQGGACRREEGWEPVHLREEIIYRKKERRIFKFFETSTGVIERKDNASDTLKDGFYISLAWSCFKEGGSPNLNVLEKLWRAQSVEEAGKLVREATLSCNWILADAHGGIAYQQSGRLPNRKHSGLYPIPAWKSENLWKGRVDSSLLSAKYNPHCGFIASANDDKNQPDKPISITLPHASYRYERICRVLSQEKIFTLEEMKALQCDIYSVQAEKFLEQIRDMIPSTPVGECLRLWDCKYDSQSQGAFLFETFYAELLQDVFGKIFGEKAWERIASRHSLLIFTHGHFDRILLSHDESWFGAEGKRECFKRVLIKTLNAFSNQELPRWGEKNRIMMNNLFFQGKLPKFLGFDVGPLEVDGNRATVAASFVFKEKKRTFAAAASYRIATDLALKEAYTILAGGVSENRFSPYYSNDVLKWLHFKYKKLIAD